MSPVRLAEAQKFLAALAGAIAQVVAVGVLHGTALHVTQIAAAVVAAVLVYLLPNATAKQPPAALSAPVPPPPPAPTH